MPDTILDRVKSNVHACEIKIAFTGTPSASVIDGWQPFYNSLLLDSDIQKLYASISSIDFSEESANSASGPFWKQKVSFRFPEHDKNRSERIALLHKIKFIIIKFDNKKELFIGRNDDEQNAFPDIKDKSNGQLCQIDLETQSIYPAGFIPNEDAFGLPTLIPLSLIST